MIRERFATLDAPAQPTPRPTAAVPPHAETLVSIATDPEATATTVSVVYKGAPTAVRTVADVRREIVGSLHDAMLNARLGEIAQQPDAPFLGAGAGGGGFVRRRGRYSIGAPSPTRRDARTRRAARRGGAVSGTASRRRSSSARGRPAALDGAGPRERDKTRARRRRRLVDALLGASPSSTPRTLELYQRLSPGDGRPT